jgi:mannose-6-phosphate isomerase-like protein (cupin superfamily)
MDNFHLTINQGIKGLQKNTLQPFVQLLKNKSMSIEYFAPKNIDTQQPHAQDEIYVITSGKSSFYRNGITIDCKTGDAIFVPAGMEHRFVNFSEDFATWVIFY